MSEPSVRDHVRSSTWTSTVLTVLLSLLSLAFGPSLLFAAPGDFDPDFGAAGIVATDFSPFLDYAFDVVVQPDGKIVAAGLSRGAANGVPTSFAVARYLEDGSLDAEFGTGGKVTSSIPGSSINEARALVRQSSGKIVAVGRAVIGSRSVFALTRYGADGNPDATFGQGGSVTSAPGTDAYALAAGLRSNDGIVAAGYATNGTPDLTVVGYLSDGALDPGFGVGGVTSVKVGVSGSLAVALAVQEDGKIVVAAHDTGASADFVVARFDTSGILDPEFGGDGIVAVPVGSGRDEPEAVVIQPDGKILVAGRIEGSSGFRDAFGIVRLLPDGGVDAEFGTQGSIIEPLDSEFGGALSVITQPNGKVIVAGFVAGDGYYDLAIVRYSAEGALDATFGDGGAVVRSLTASSDSIYALALQVDGKIVGVGHYGNERFAVVRLEGDRCGNGIVDQGEACDVGDANGSSASCCTLQCSFRPADTVCRIATGVCDVEEACAGTSGTCPPDLKSTALCRLPAHACDVEESCDGVTDLCPDDVLATDGAQCDDADACTITSSCVSGACVGTTPQACPTCMSCDPSQGCVPTPAAGCRLPTVPGKSRLVLRDRAKDGLDLLQWTWRSGAATAKSEFGSPLTTTSYDLCIYESSRATHVALPAGGQCGVGRPRPCWTATRAGFVYASSSGPLGSLNLKLSEGVGGKAKIEIRQRGTQVPMPTLPLSRPVLVQLRNSSSAVCWESEFNPLILRNDVKQFVGLSD